MEYFFIAGDQADIVFGTGPDAWAVVEIKIGEIGELVKGVYQAIKYRALLQAEKGHGISPQVDAVLVAYGIPSDVSFFAAKFGIRCRIVVRQKWDNSIKMSKKIPPRTSKASPQTYRRGKKQGRNIYSDILGIILAIIGIAVAITALLPPYYDFLDKLFHDVFFPSQVLSFSDVNLYRGLGYTGSIIAVKDHLNLASVDLGKDPTKYDWSQITQSCITPSDYCKVNIGLGKLENTQSIELDIQNNTYDKRPVLIVGLDVKLTGFRDIPIATLMFCGLQEVPWEAVQ